MSMSQACWISFRKPVVSSSTFSLRILPCTISDTATDSDDAKNQSTDIDTVSELVVRSVFLEIGESSDKGGAIGKGDLKA